jgi:hypothetical protein
MGITPARPGRALLRGTLALALCAPTLAACASAVQPQPVPTNPLERLIALREYPAYWLGQSFHGLPLSEVGLDRSGAVHLQYGECVRGGQYACVAPIALVTSPDNSFVPHGSSRVHVGRLRSVRSYATAHGLTIVVPTGPVVVSIYAQSAALARAAAQGMAPLNELRAPDEPLPRPLPASPFARSPLPLQMTGVKGQAQ